MNALATGARRPEKTRSRTRLAAVPVVLVLLAFSPDSPPDPGPNPGPDRGIVYTSSPTGHSEQIWIMNPDGSQARSLTPAMDSLNERFPVWSPDGSAIAFLSNRHAPGRARPAIFVMNADGTSAWKVGPDSVPYQGAPDFSPDGRQIVFSGGGLEGGPLKTDLYLMDLYGGNVQRLTQLDGFVACPRWSPDGERILFSKDIDQLLVVDVKSGRVSHALPDGVEGGCGDWSPDGTKLAFSSGPDRQLPTFDEVLMNPSFPQEIFVYDLHHEGLAHLPQAGAHATYPRWSEDGQRIVFQGHIPPGDPRHPGFMPLPGAAEVYVMGADGSEVRRLTHNSRMDGQPNW